MNLCIRWLKGVLSASITLVVAMAIHAHAHAQGSHSFNGKWLAYFAGDKAANRTANMEIKDEGGYYEAAYKGQTNYCAGMNNSIVVKIISEQEIEVEILRKQVRKECDNTTMRLRRKDEKTLEGTITAGWLGDGRPIVLVRR
jgi:hypothetical protein